MIATPPVARFRHRFGIGAAVYLALAYCWGAELPSSRGTQAPPATLPGQAAVRSIALPHFEPNLPVAPGRDEFMAVCVSCHSARYVTMQSRFTQPQWEQIVDKMAKVFGAQIDSEQKKAIIGYLVAIHGPNSASQPPSVQDDEFDSTPASKLPPRSEAAPLLQPAARAAERAVEVKRGADLFAQSCAGCHGPTGKGDGWVAPVLLPRPKDLTANRFSARLLSQVFWSGKPGTAMPSWRSLPSTNLTALAAYVQTLHPPATPGPASPEVLQRGARVFQQNCAPCHGASGDGNGATAGNLFPRPASFRLKQPDQEYILRILTTGIPGTAMPSWKEQIAEPDREAVAEFVRSLFEAEGR